MTGDRDSFLLPILFGKSGEYYQRADERDGGGEKGDAHQKNTAECPDTAGDAVCREPVGLAVQRPADLDAYGVALLTFRQVVADDGKHQTQEKIE